MGSDSNFSMVYKKTSVYIGGDIGWNWKPPHWKV